MTNLDINAYGVQEMNKQEMIQTEGGFWPIVVAAIAIIGAVTSSCVYVKKEENTYVYTNSDVENSSNQNNGHGSGANVSRNGSKNQ